jgi:hypothetical protein
MYRSSSTFSYIILCAYVASSSLFVVFVVVIGGLLFRVSGENILLENEMAPRNYVLVLLG